jgi:hypothetical protein
MAETFFTTDNFFTADILPDGKYIYLGKRYPKLRDTILGISHRSLPRLAVSGGNVSRMLVSPMLPRNLVVPIDLDHLENTSHATVVFFSGRENQIGDIDALPRSTYFFVI